ncbi:hypothetical protein HK101_002102 [Irineochytrium annulatum]|nr:hypothetical protein HK101_002102 [Irineochytrium annulatum]
MHSLNDDVLLDLLHALNRDSLATCLVVSKFLFLASAPILWSHFDAWPELDRLYDDSNPAPWTAAWRQNIYLRSVRILSVCERPTMTVEVFLPRLGRLDAVAFFTNTLRLGGDDRITVPVTTQAWVNAILERLRRGEGPKAIAVDGTLLRRDMAALLSFRTVTSVTLTSSLDDHKMAASLQHGVERLQASAAFVAKYAPTHGGSLQSLVIHGRGSRVWATEPASWNLTGLSCLEVDVQGVEPRLPDILNIVTNTLKKLVLKTAAPMVATDASAIARLQGLRSLKFDFVGRESGGRDEVPLHEVLSPLATLKNLHILQLSVYRVLNPVESLAALLGVFLQGMCSLNELYIHYAKTGLRCRAQIRTAFVSLYHVGRNEDFALNVYTGSEPWVEDMLLIVSSGREVKGIQ